jgi:AraC-like DNA-binding protein/mannose-6-phosphate isomerase-like protein (cupin superfamily)
MKHFRPLYLQNFNVEARGFRLLRLQVNRHLRELDRVEPHAHDNHQILIYLAGGGYQVVEDSGFAVQGGSMVWLAPGVSHAFRETGRTRPLCLVLDFLGPASAASSRVEVVQLSQRERNELREHASDLMRQPTAAPEEAASLRASGRVLMLLDLALGRLGMARHGAEAPPSPVVRSVRRQLQDAASRHLPLADLSRRIGYQPDYLNRLLRQSTGLTLGQMRAQKLLEEAEKRLAAGRPVGDVAEELGFSDQNYFARWFRKQTGLAPTRWRGGG